MKNSAISLFSVNPFSCGGVDIDGGEVQSLFDFRGQGFFQEIYRIFDISKDFLKSFIV
jgi:hypothetical protein